MNEKDKMIEEMAKILGDCSDIKYCEDISCEKCNAQRLYTAGYRKIPEGSVVLSKEEYSNYLVLKNDYAHAKEKNKKLQADNERLYNNLAKFKKSVQTETLEKIKLIPIECGEECGHYYLDISVTGKELLQRVYFTSSFIDGKIRKETAKEILSMIDKIPTNTVNELNHLRLLKINIAKQFGVEVEE